MCLSFGQGIVLLSINIKQNQKQKKARIQGGKLFLSVSEESLEKYVECSLQHSWAYFISGIPEIRQINKITALNFGKNQLEKVEVAESTSGPSPLFPTHLSFTIVQSQ